MVTCIFSWVQGNNRTWAQKCHKCIHKLSTITEVEFNTGEDFGDIRIQNANIGLWI